MIQAHDELRALLDKFHNDRIDRVFNLKNCLTAVDSDLIPIVYSELVVALFEEGLVQDAEAVVDEVIEKKLWILPENPLHLMVRLFERGISESVCDRLVYIGLDLAYQYNAEVVPSARAYWIRTGWGLLVLLKQSRGEDFRLELEKLKEDEDWRRGRNDVVMRALKCKVVHAKSKHLKVGDK